MAPDRLTGPTNADMRSARDYREHRVPRGTYHLYAREYPGQEPAIVLMHGFPDNLHLYDRLVPELAGRRVVSFDFLGWGGSDKPAGYPYTATNQTGVKGAQIRSCSSAVLVQQAAEQVAPTHSALLILGDNGQPGGLIWRLEPERPVRAVFVVVP